MRFKYSKFQGFDVFGINLGELMDRMSDALLDSGYDDDYYWTRQQKETDNSLDAFGAPSFRRSWIRASSTSNRSERCSLRTKASFAARCSKSC